MALGGRPIKSDASEKAWHRPMDWPAEEDKTKNLCSKQESMNLSKGLFAAGPLTKNSRWILASASLEAFARERHSACFVASLARLRLKVTSPPLVDGYNTYQVCDIVPYDPDGMISDLFTGRAMNKQQINFTMACSWVRKCEEWHGEGHVVRRKLGRLRQLGCPSSGRWTSSRTAWWKWRLLLRMSV
ncbi:hypothetical protein BDN71DRAFT_1441398 [Pleurotus eryngii]|uniref:Uncharacterized protein n=1 Tax=Pleurotus eryngii TaxID=5323 RepID=A0A9P6DCK6_PLEER|nr:hypothetical protein BDN71DRAFT_1441398 [Pleurotus eryngii]